MEQTLTKNTFQKYSEYKDSGAPWIGEIPSHWKTEKGKWLFIKNERPVRGIDGIVTCFRDGEVTLRSNRRTDGFTNALKEHGYQGIRKGDLVIHAMDAFAGAIGVSDSDGKSTPVYSACTERFENSVNQYYYAYFLRSLALNGVIVSLAKGIRERSTDFRFKDFGELTLTFPPLPEQTAIAHFLDEKTIKIDQAITQKEKMIALLKERKQIIIQNAVTKGLDPNVKLKDSGVEWIGEIPEHWEICAVKYTLSIPITDGPHTTPILLDEGYPFISAESIKNGEIDFNKKRGFISEKNHKEYCKKYKPQRGDIYMVKSGATTGNIGMVDTDKEFSIWSPLAVFRADPNILSNNYLYNFLESYSFKKGVELKWSFGTQQNIGMGVLSNLFIAFGTIEEQERIVKHIKNCSVKISKIILSEQTQIEKLKEYKATLIDSAVTGKIKVC